MRSAQRRAHEESLSGLIAAAQHCVHTLNRCRLHAAEEPRAEELTLCSAQKRRAHERTCEDVDRARAQLACTNLMACTEDVHR